MQKLVRGKRSEQTDVTPMIDPDVKALINFMRREEIVCSSHSNPELAKMVVNFLTHRKRH
jgi:hypothetical protein